MIKNFLEQLRVQRWDDHRYYHHSRINQSLHFVSAISFLIGYVMIFFDPVASVQRHKQNGPRPLHRGPSFEVPVGRA